MCLFVISALNKLRVVGGKSRKNFSTIQITLHKTLLQCSSHPEVFYKKDILKDTLKPFDDFKTKQKKCMK